MRKVNSNFIRSSNGGVIIEAIIVMPIFFIAIFCFIWAGHFFNSKSSLTTTLIRALRVSDTRGNMKLGEGTIIDIEDWYSKGADPSTNSRLGIC